MSAKKIVLNKTKLSQELQKSVQKGDWDRAILILDRLERLDPANPTYPLRRGDYYLKKGWKEEAIKSYGQAARGFVDGGFIVKALAAYKVILRQEPDHAEALSEIQALHERSQAQVAAPPPPAPSAPAPVPITPDTTDDSEEVTERIEIERTEVADQPSPAMAENARSLVETDPELLDEGFLGVTHVDYDSYLSTSGDFGKRESVELSSAPQEFEIERSWEGPSSSGTGAVPTASNVVPLFASLSPEEFGEFTRSLMPLQYPSGTAIVKEGDQGDSVYIISYGSVKIATRLKGQDVQLGVLGENDFFGEVAFLTGKPRTASVIAAEPTEVLELQGEDLRQIVERYPAVKKVLQDFHRARVQATIDKVRNERALI